MSSRRLTNLQEKAARVQEYIRTLEKIVQLKDTVSYINDNTVVAQSLFPSSLELWKKIVAAQIQLYKLREKEKILRKEYEKEQNRIIDFSVLDKYRRYKHKKTDQQDNTEEESTTDDRTTDQKEGFEIRFKLSNAYEAIRRQEQVLTRPHLNPFIEKQSKAGPVYFFYDRADKQWKRFYPNREDERKHEQRRARKQRFINTRGLPFFMQQQLNKINSHPRDMKRLPSLSYSRQASQLPTGHRGPGEQGQTQAPLSRIPSVSVPSQMVPSRDSTFIAKRPSASSATKRTDSRRHHHQIIEETKDLLDDDDPVLEASLPDPDPTSADDATTQGFHRSKSKLERKKIEKLKLVASQMNVLQEELQHEKEHEEDEALVDDEEMFKNCRYLYRLSHCRCIGRHSNLVAEEIRKQVAGTIDLLDHDDEGDTVGTVECVYCMATPRAHVNNWLASLQTGSTCGVYGDPRYDWFPKLKK